MALPTTQTATLIVTEALNKAGVSNPSSVRITRFIDFALEEIKNDLFQRKDWKLYEDTKVLIPDAYVQRIADPTDFQKMLQVKFYDGTHKGTMQTATASTIDLEADEDITEEGIKGKLVFMTSGNAKAESSRVVSYNESTMQAGIKPNWGTTPTSGGYMVADIEKELVYLPNESIAAVAATGYPSVISFFDKEFYLDVVPDKSTYAIMMKFLVAVHQLDLTSTRYTTLLTEWRTALVAGVYWKVLLDDDDDRAKGAEVQYERSVLKLKQQDARNRRQRGNSFIRPIGGMPT
jgi:hypothetical protein